MSLKSIFESIWSYDFSHWLIYLAIIFGALFNLICILRLSANIFKFKEIKKDFNYFAETIAIIFILLSEIFIVYLLYFN